MIDDRQDRALDILGKIQESMVKDLIEDLVQNEESYTGDGAFDNSYNFSLQDLEDKYAMKLWNIQRFINEVYKLNTPPDLPEHRVEVVFAEKGDLAEAINRRLAELKPVTLIDVKIQREEQSYLAMIVYTPYDPRTGFPEG
jgi:hypothetical protein